MCDSIQRIIDSRSIDCLSRRLQNLCCDYRYQPLECNIDKIIDVVQLCSDVQNNLMKTLGLVACEAERNPCTSAAIRCRLQMLNSKLACCTDTCKNLENYQLKMHRNELVDDFNRSMKDLERRITQSDCDKAMLKCRLSETENKLRNTERNSSIERLANDRQVRDLKYKLRDSEFRAMQLSDSQKQLQDAVENGIRIMSRGCSPATICRSASTDATIERLRSRRERYDARPRMASRSPSPCCDACARSSSPIPCRSLSPLSPSSPMQVCSENDLIQQYNTLYCCDRRSAIDQLKAVQSCDPDMNDRITFAVIRESFRAAKSAFQSWKTRCRLQVSRDIYPDKTLTLEERTQNHINSNVKTFDIEYLICDVTLALTRDSRLRLPSGIRFNYLTNFIRCALRVAFQMSSLAYPLDIAIALDSECFDPTRYRRSADSDICSVSVHHHIWPTLMQCGKVICKGEVKTGISCCDTTSLDCAQRRLCC
ncbi:hypothetical protein SNEBB_007540 [Seison nebaliae]|nr:hypothetical protein SNEBB_007540 [Seison nebaliae]